jgi:imidazolonepropionase-like amidohydrolase
VKKKLENGPVLIEAGWLLDGTGTPPLKDVLLEIQDGEILSIGAPKNPTGKDMPCIDLTSYTLIPGLIEGHAHLFLSGTTDPGARHDQCRTKFESLEKLMQQHLNNYMSDGIVAVRDAGDWANHALRYKMAYQARTKKPPILHVAGKAWHAPGRYGKLLGSPPVAGKTLPQSIQATSEHIDHVKIVNSGINSLSHFGKETPPQFDGEILAEAIRAARQLGLKTMVHANGKIPVRMAIDGGCHSLEHGFFMGKDNLKRMVEKKIIWVPTAVTMAAVARLLDPAGQERETARRILDHQLEQLSLALTYGVPVAVGTDAGSPGVHHGFALKEEISILVSAGYSIEKAIQCGTSNGADLLGIQDRFGKIACGLSADCLAIKGRPDQLLSNLNTPLRIIDLVG